ncbi:MAG: four helix bundle protein [Bacillota bacterium]
MKLTSFEDLECWKLSREIVKKVYNLTSREGFRKDFGLRDQIQRAGVSIMANISEGFDSGTDKSFLIFLSYSYRSASEVQSLLYVALDLEYINKSSFEELYQNIKNVKGLLSGLKRYLTNSPKKIS